MIVQNNFVALDARPEDLSRGEAILTAKLAPEDL